MKRWQNTFLVGMRKCNMTYSKSDGLKAEWDPAVPFWDSMSDQERQQYRNGRDALLAEVAKELGGSALVVEL